MTDETQTNPDDNKPLEEFALLKERAKTLGIHVPGNIGIDTLKAKVAAVLAGEKTETPGSDSTSAGMANMSRPMTKSELEQKLREDQHAEHMALVRCKIYNLNPSKRDIQGEIITVANRYLGTVRKFIPFGEATDNGYHIPKIIYEELKSRRFQSITTKQVKGQIEHSSRQVPEYSIEILPPLTEEELEELAIRQSAAERMGAGD